jgi:hypothetical protein
MSNNTFPCPPHISFEHPTSSNVCCVVSRRRGRNGASLASVAGPQGPAPLYPQWIRQIQPHGFMSSGANMVVTDGGVVVLRVGAGVDKCVRRPSVKIAWHFGPFSS